MIEICLAGHAQIQQVVKIGEPNGASRPGPPDEMRQYREYHANHDAKGSRGEVAPFDRAGPPNALNPEFLSRFLGQFAKSPGGAWADASTYRNTSADNEAATRGA